MGRILWCLATWTIRTQGKCAPKGSDATILHDSFSNGGIAATDQRALGKSRGAEVRSV